MIFKQINDQLHSLNSLLLNLNDEQYQQKIVHLGNYSIAGHARHIIELLKCAIDGYAINQVDYLNRVRNLEIENSRSVAVKELENLLQNLWKEDKPLDLVIPHNEARDVQKVTTTYYREIVYNTEHIIHHLALIRVALRELKLEIVPPDFGMAYATLDYLANQNKLSQS